jgi:peroxiredoxin
MKTKILIFNILIIAGLIPNASLLGAEDPKTLEIGTAAPSFSLPGVDGKTYTLDSFKAGKILVIIFTADHCPTAQAYEDRIEKLYQEFHPKSVEFVLISPNNPQAVCLE